MDRQHTSQTTCLTLVVPAVRDAVRVQATVEALVKEFQATDLSFEVIVVDDGSQERIADRLAGSHESVRTIRFEQNRGKGAALRRAFAESRGRFVVFTDEDLPYGLTGVQDCLRALQSGADAVIGDRTLPESRMSVHVPLPRRILSFFSHPIVKRLSGGVRDTQCGLKGFRGELARMLAPRLVVDRYATDVEILHAIAMNHLPVQRVPVVWVSNGPSRVKLFRDTVQTGWDILRIAARGRCGLYTLPAGSNIADVSCKWKRT
ncbi:MAG: glycosyltransferase [Chloroflexi bacterium]|nr:glycosyltransferase [Chloroflexota bacterium]